MCFVIHPRYPEVQTAKRDVVCYKEGFPLTDGTFAPFYKTYFSYRLGEVTKLPDKQWPVEWEDNSDLICVGFHSYSNKKKLSTRTTHVKCIIPKGAHYFYNPEDKEYVSDQIIVQEFMP